MDRYFWVSTRRIKPDTREQFEQAWRPAEFPAGLVAAYVLYAGWASRSGTPQRRATATAAPTSRPAAGRRWIPSCSRSGRASTPAGSWESQAADESTPERFKAPLLRWQRAARPRRFATLLRPPGRRLVIAAGRGCRRKWCRSSSSADTRSFVGRAAAAARRQSSRLGRREPRLGTQQAPPQSCEALSAESVVDGVCLDLGIACQACGLGSRRRA
jgi:hypothetical protein